MKKIYTKPAFILVDIAAEGMIAGSLAYDPNKDGNQMLGNRKGGWYSESWTDTDTEED